MTLLDRFREGLTNKYSINGVSERKWFSKIEDNDRIYGERWAFPEFEHGQDSYIQGKAARTVS
ncbi:hypothetical protein O9929_22300 [Vibrio lentus]|nr:hypothetical protein [Vibrio lentus]